MPKESHFTYALGYPAQIPNHIFSRAVAENSMNLYTAAFWADEWSESELELLKRLDDFEGWHASLPFSEVETGEGESEAYSDHRKRYGLDHFSSFGSSIKHPWEDDLSNWSWVVIAILTFATRRKLNPFEVHFLLSWLDQFEDNLLLPEYKTSPSPYVVYEDILDEPVRSSEFTAPIGRHGGGSYTPPGPGARYVYAGFTPEIGGGGATGVDVSIDADVAIPVFQFFPKWGEDIVKRFHRSDDPDMKEYAKKLDDWIVSMENTIKGG